MGRSPKNKAPRPSSAKRVRQSKVKNAGFTAPVAESIRIPRQGSQISTKTLLKKEKKRAQRTATEFPGLQERMSEEARRLVPGKGVLAYRLPTDEQSQAKENNKSEDEDDAKLKRVSSCSSPGASSPLPPLPTSSSAEPSEKMEAKLNDDFISLETDSDGDSDDSQADPRTGNLNEQFASYEREERNSMEPRSDDDFASPWLGKDRINDSRSPGEQLTSELLDFTRYMSPSPQEVKRRNDCVKRLRRITSHMWPGSTVSVFGSFATGLYLPDADIDVVIMTGGSISPSRLRSEMYRLRARLKSHQIAENVDVIAHARVPIVKYVDSSTNIPLDIAFDQSSGRAGAEVITRWLREQPALKPIALAARQFLRRRKLHEVVNGGLGGFATVCLAYSFIKSHPVFRDLSPELALKNVGLLLLEFFQFYGSTFDSSIYVVKTTPNYEPYLKRLNPDMRTQKNTPAIQDPNDSANNISKGSYNFASVRRGFANAAEYLKVLSYEWSKLSSEERGEMSFLAPLLKFDGSEKPRTPLSLAESLRTPALVDTDGSVVPATLKRKPQQQQQQQQQQLTRGKRGRPGPESIKVPAIAESKTIAPGKATARINSTIRTEGTPRRAATALQDKASRGNGSQKSFDPFEMEDSSSSLSNSDQETSAHSSSSDRRRSLKRERENGGGNNPNDTQKMRRTADDSDSRIRLTTAERRQFWKRKAGTPPNPQTSASEDKN